MAKKNKLHNLTVTDLIDVNQASASELSCIPGIGKGMAARIISGRPYSSLNDLLRIQGINPKALDNLKIHLTVSIPSSQEDPVIIPLPSETPSPALYSPEEDKSPAIDHGDISHIVLSNEMPTDKPRQENILKPTSQPDNIIDQSEQKSSSPVNQSIMQMIPLPRIASQAEEHKKDSPPLKQRSSTPEPALSPARLSLFLAGACLLTLILSISISLMILGAINRGLYYPSLSQYENLKYQSDTASNQIETMKQDLDSLRTRLDVLENVTGRVTNLEKETRSIKQQLDETQNNLDKTQGQIKQLDSKISDLLNRSQVFEKFLAGLKSLLGNLIPPSPEK